MNIFDLKDGSVNEVAMIKMLLPIEHSHLSGAIWNMSWILHNIWTVAHSEKPNKELLKEYAEQFRFNYKAQYDFDMKKKNYTKKKLKCKHCGHNNKKKEYFGGHVDFDGYCSKCSKSISIMDW